MPSDEKIGAIKAFKLTDKAKVGVYPVNLVFSVDRAVNQDEPRTKSFSITITISPCKITKFEITPLSTTTIDYTLGDQVKEIQLNYVQESPCDYPITQSLSGDVPGSSVFELDTSNNKLVVKSQIDKNTAKEYSMILNAKIEERKSALNFDV